MGIEVITIAVGGAIYSAFERVRVHAAFNEAARSFVIEVAAELGPSATNALFEVGTPVSIYANSDLLLTGHVDEREPYFDAWEARISVSGRSSSADLIDGSAEHKTGRFENKDPKEIGDELSSEYSGTGFDTDQQLEKLEQYQLTPGASVFREIEKLARQQGMTLAGTAEGRIKITKAGSARHTGSLVEGKNMLSGGAKHNGANRHSKYVVRGQRPFGHGEENLEIEAEEDDSAVNRHRPLILYQDDDTTKERAKKRAKNRKDRAAGNALKATVSVQGFRDEAGQVWTPGYLVWTESPFLDVAQDMLIESVDYRQDNRTGSIATLALTDPRSYGGAGGKGNQSGDAWNIGDDTE